MVLMASVPLRLGATSFAISAPSTTAQNLGSGSPSAGQTGTVNAGSTLTVSGSTVAVTISGNNETLTNLGTISQTGTGRVIRDNTGVTGLVINNGSTTNSTALMQSTDADVIQMNKTPASVTLNNYGRMIAGTTLPDSGNQAVDFNAILSGTNIVNNFSTGVMLSTQADGVRPGVNGVVNNAGMITGASTIGASSDGVDAQTNTGVTINNVQTDSSVAPTISGARHGITGGNTDVTVNGGAYAMSVLNGTGALIRGNDGSGINIDGINGNELVTITNNGTITGNGVTADGDGVDVDGLVHLTNTGTIKSLNALNDVSEGVTVGGGTITNSSTGVIQGSISTPAGNTGVGRGITIAGVDKDASDNPIPVQAPYGPTTITNSGLIKGDSDSSIAFTSALASGFTNVINNMAGGTLQGGGTLVAAVVTGADNDTINNAGTIDGTSSGKAISMGAGNDTLNITGGVVLGNVDMGAGNDTLSITGWRLQVGPGAVSNLEQLILGAGTFDLNDFSEGSAGVAGIGSFALSATSWLDFGDLGLGSNVIDFGAVGAHTSGSVLEITDYDFGLDHFFFQGLSSALTTIYGTTDVCFDGLCGYGIVDVNSVSSGSPLL